VNISPRHEEERNQGSKRQHGHRIQQATQAGAVGGLLPQYIAAHHHTRNPLQTEENPQRRCSKPPGQAKQERWQIQQQVVAGPLRQGAEYPQRKRHQQRAYPGIQQKGKQQQMQQRMQPQPNAANDQPALSPIRAHAANSNTKGMNSE